MTDDSIDSKEMLTQTLIGKRISKRFSGGIYLGTITSTWIDDNHNQYWWVRYDDEDGEDLNLKEIREALQLYQLYPHEYRFNDYATPTTLDISNERGADILNKRGADISTEKEVNNTPPRCSTRLKRKEKLPEKCLKTIATLGVILFTSSAIVQPITTSVQPPLSPSNIEQIFLPEKVQPTLPTNLEPTDTVEELRAYHSYLDKLNDMFSPDPHLQHWTPDTILSHHVQHCHDDKKRKVFLKVQWSDGDLPRQYLQLDDLCMDEPWLCARYAYKNDLVYKPGWEWIPKYLESDKVLTTMVHTYRTSVLSGKKYEFGVEIPKTP
jgi:hypothetical protein